MTSLATSETYTAGLSRDQLLAAWRTMLLSRRIDDKEVQLKRQNKIFFQISGADIAGIEFRNGSNGQVFALGELNFTAAAVPEPASWAMMIAGFGLVGATARRRRGTVVTA